MTDFYVSSQKMPGINFDAPISPQDMGFLFDDTFSVEQRRRLQLAMAFERVAGPAYGIVDEVNPNSALPNSGRPLLVSASIGDPLLFDVQPGVVVTKSGNIVVLNTLQEGLAPNSSALNVVNVVFVEYITVGATPVGTRYLLSVDKFRVIPADSAIVQSVTLADFQNATIFPASRLNDVVVIALVSKVNGLSNTGFILDVDLTNNINAFNRPWFSTVDVEHRSKLGTGTATDTNTHALGFNDMSQGNQTIYNQLLSFGMVQSKDYGVPGCPGKLCQELISDARIYTDGTGAVTGITNAKYARLLGYPLRVVGAVAVNSATNAIAVRVIPHSNILVLATGENSAGGFNLYYTASDAVEPPVDVLTNDTMTFGLPDASKELIISGGMAHESLPVSQLQLGQAGPFPKHYNIWLDKSQQFVLGPQIVVCSKKLDAAAGGVGTVLNKPDFPMYGPAKLKLGLSGPAFSQSDSTVSVLFSGKDTTGATITETLVFSDLAGNYSPITIPDTTCGNEPLQYLTTSKVFASLDTWQGTTVDVDPNMVVMIWADVGPTVTPALDEALPVAAIRWNGQAVCQIRDIRPVNYTLQRPQEVPSVMREALSTVQSLEVAETLFGSAVHGFQLLAADDFNDPRWVDNVLSRRSRHSDGLRSAFEPQQIEATISPEFTVGEYFYTRAIPVPAIGVHDKLLVALYSLNDDTFFQNVAVEFSISRSSSPTVWTSWQNVPVMMSSTSSLWRMADLTVEPDYFKVKFRFAGSSLRGFAAILKVVR